MAKSKKATREDWGLLLLRLVMVVVFIYHGLPKAIDWTMATSKFVGMGFPGFLGPIVGIIEVVAAVLIIIGFWHTWANYVLAVVIAVAIIFVQIPGAMDAGKLLTAGLERDLFILVGALVLAWHGPGKFVLVKEFRYILLLF